MFIECLNKLRNMRLLAFFSDMIKNVHKVSDKNEGGNLKDKNDNKKLALNQLINIKIW